MDQSKRKDRPCDACRKRKSRCVVEEGSIICILCKFHSQACTFEQNPQPRKRKLNENGEIVKRRQSTSYGQPRRSSENQARVIKTNSGTGVEEYDDLEGPSLLKQTLGLRNQHHSQFIGDNRGLEPALLGELTNGRTEVPLNGGILRRVSPSEAFLLLPDQGTQGYLDELEDLDAIEAIVRPYGEALVSMYFRIVFPSFPILHKEVFLEKYSRSYREFSPPLLAAVYLMALYYWTYDDTLNKLKKPDVQQLEKLARKALGDTIHRPKLSTVQAGLLLLQHTGTDSAELTAQLVSVAYGLGLHLDASDWTIPHWEKGLRKRLGWAVYMQDQWSSLGSGRPSLITSNNWALLPVTDSDFPENAAHENDQEGSTEVEKGRILFTYMISLSTILADLLDTLFNVRIAREISQAGEGGLKIILEKAKPVQIRLKEWLRNLPDCLAMDSAPVLKLNSVGYLRLAYVATEISLHRRILLALSPATDIQLQHICRSVAHERFMFAIEFIHSLKPQHLSSFWYFVSPHNFALIAVFGTLLLATASTTEESEFYRTKLKEYRWTLKINSENGARYMRPAMSLLDINLSLIEEAKMTTQPREAPISRALNSRPDDDVPSSATSYDEESPQMSNDQLSLTNDFASPGNFSFDTPFYPRQHAETTSPVIPEVPSHDFGFDLHNTGSWY